MPQTRAAARNPANEDNGLAAYTTAIKQVADRQVNRCQDANFPTRLSLLCLAKLLGATDAGVRLIQNTGCILSFVFLIAFVAMATSITLAALSMGAPKIATVLFFLEDRLTRVCFGGLSETFL